MRVLVATDAWHPQVNGVVRTYERLALEAPNFGFEVSFLTPSAFRTIPCPSYPEIRLALASPRAIAAEIDKTRPDFIHIATEGPIGVMTRRYCRKTRHPFTTSYHTKFPEYVAARLPVPEFWCYALQRRFHNGAAATFVATQSLAEELRSRGFERLTPWSRGVDTKLFRPRKARLFGRKPVFLYVGRISVEKNLRAFLDLELPGRKVLVGSGPQEAELRRLYPEAFFAGPKQGLELARAYASADVFVFPSLTDTFGLVLLEALASGLPVAAFPVSGPRDILAGNRAGAMSDDLKAAVLEALALDKAEARRLAITYSWQNSARQFIEAVLAAHHIGLPQRRRRWRHKRRRPSRGATGPSRSYSSVWGTLGGSRVSSEMVTAAPDFKETAAKNAVE